MRCCQGQQHGQHIVDAWFVTVQVSKCALLVLGIIDSLAWIGVDDEPVLGCHGAKPICRDLRVVDLGFRSGREVFRPDAASHPGSRRRNTVNWKGQMSSQASQVKGYSVVAGYFLLIWLGMGTGLQQVKGEAVLNRRQAPQAGSNWPDYCANTRPVEAAVWWWTSPTDCGGVDT